MIAGKEKIFMLIAGLAFLICVSCGDPAVPKPRGYFRIEMPEHQYVEYDSIGEPYGFERSKWCVVVADHDDNAEPHWINIVYPKFNCKIHVTYREINGNVDEVLEDSRKLVYKHTVKADAIGESYFDSPERKVYASLYRIKGNAATPLQFALTDSIANLFRGSVYFNSKPNADSLAPVVAYLEDDIAHIIETFNWKK